MSASKNSKFAQMQGARKILPRSIWGICKQKILLGNAAGEMKFGFLEALTCRN
jgi:hypothetical protein